MIELYNDAAKERFEQVKKFAKEVGAIDEFQSGIDYLSSFGGNESKVKCVLFTDFADLSFRFVMYSMNHQSKKFEEFWFNGGLIYSGPGQPSDGSAPSFTVSLDSDAAKGKSHKWSVHT